MRKAIGFVCGIIGALLCSCMALFALSPTIVHADINEPNRASVSVTGEGIVEGNTYYLEWTSLSFVYNGNRQAPSAVLKCEQDEGYEAMSTIVVKNGEYEDVTSVDVGAFIAVAEFDGLTFSNNENWKEFSILPLSVAVEWNKAESYTYSGNVQGPTASYKDVSGSPIALTPSGYGMDAGSYTASILENAAGNNYTLTNLTCNYEIGKSTGLVLWVAADDYVENDQLQGPRAFFVGENGQIIELEVKSRGKEAGDYVAEIDITPLETNFVVNGDLTYKYTIAPEEMFGTGGVVLSVILMVVIIALGAIIGYLISSKQKSNDKVTKLDEGETGSKELIDSNKEKQLPDLGLDKSWQKYDETEELLTKLRIELSKCRQKYEEKKELVKKLKIELEELTKRKEGELEEIRSSLRDSTLRAKELFEENEKLKVEKSEEPDFYKHPIEDYFPKIDEAFQRAQNCRYDENNPLGSFVSQRQELEFIMELIEIYRSQRR